MSKYQNKVKCQLCLVNTQQHEIFICLCGYEICLICYNAIMEDENYGTQGKCPSCLQSINQMRQKYRQTSDQYKPCVEEPPENKLDLKGLRILQKNLMYVIGLSPEIADESQDYFGQYGDLRKIVVNNQSVYNHTNNGPSYSAYVTFYTEEEATAAIQAIDGFQIHNRTLRASYGTTKYCNYFIKDLPCPNQDCLYMHELGKRSESYTKEDMQRNKHLQHKVPSVQNQAIIKENNDFVTIFPPSLQKIQTQSYKKKQTQPQNQQGSPQGSRYSFATVNDDITCPVSEELHKELMQTIDNGFQNLQAKQQKGLLEMSQSKLLYRGN